MKRKSNHQTERGGGGEGEGRIIEKSSVDEQFQFISVHRPIGLSGEHEGRFNRDSLPVFSAGGPCEQFWHRLGCPLFDVVHPAFPLPTTVWSTLQGALKDGFVEAVVACDMPEA